MSKFHISLTNPLNWMVFLSSLFSIPTLYNSPLSRPLVLSIETAPLSLIKVLPVG